VPPSVPPFVLTILKVALLALLYLFIWRAVRAVVRDVAPKERTPRTPAKTSPRKRRGAPTKVVLLSARGGRVSTHRLSGTVEIGRAASCAIRPEDTYISQEHARISNRNGSWVLEDLGSTNGTYLNQRRITVPTEISAGDQIRVGKTVLEVRR
jgi:pSer/pThr/pTyr-binding forkhead associated (FHA) protein